jgi:transcriptional regulator with XRE-family HTH domain
MPQNPFHSHLGRRLRDARRSARVSQGVLASRVGVSLPTVRQAERGQGGTAAFLRMAQALDLEVAGGSLPPGRDLGQRLKVLRQRQGLSQREVAARAACSPTTVAAIERGGLGHLATLEAVGDAVGARLTLVGQGCVPGFVGGAATSSAWLDWATPPDFLERLYSVVGDRFDLDPCSPGKSRSRVKARRHYTELDDGLSLPWRGNVFMNPPYGRRLSAWTHKARAEVDSRHASMVIGLVPARTDTGWWHRDIAGHADILLLRGRIRFGDGSTPAPFPSAIVVWGGSPEVLRRVTAEFPQAQFLPRDAQPGVPSVPLAAD